MSVEPASLSIIKYPDPRLRRRTQPIAAVTDEVVAVAQRMLALMHEVRGVGLAAPQVGLSWRMFVVNSGAEGEADGVYINPVLFEPLGDPEPGEEGCLSIPEVYGEVWRPVGISIEAVGVDGKSFRREATGLLARAWQHEMDHLEGKLIIDRFGQMDRLSNRRRLRDLERAAVQ